MFAIKRKEPVNSGLRRASIERIERSIDLLNDVSEEPVRAVHQSRVNMKRLRAVLRMIRPVVGDEVYKRENRCFRNVSRQLSGLRDATVMLQTFDVLLRDRDEQPDAEAIQAIRAGMEHDLCAAAVQSEPEPQVDQHAHRRTVVFRILADLAEARIRAQYWPIPDDDFKVLAGGLRTTYQEARRLAGKAARSNGSRICHEWRKQAKYLLYQTRLLVKTWPAMIKAYRESLDELADCLGEHHDLTLLRRQINSRDDSEVHQEAVDQLNEIIEKRLDNLLLQARVLGRRLFVESPSQFINRIDGYWHAWRNTR